MTAQVTESIHDGVLVMTIDNPPVNAGAQGVRAGLLAGIGRLTASSDLIAGVIVGKGGNFMAGSDITEFGGPVPRPLLPEVIAAIEECRRTVVAAIDGVALGGGLELALGCDARIATPRAAVGLPEVTLGMVPGAGGTQRLPRLVGRAAAIEVIVSGRRLSAEEAHELGIVDRIVAEDLVARACELARTTSKRPTSGLEVPAEDPAAVDDAATKVLRRARPNAVEAAQLVRSAGVEPIEAALSTERAVFDRYRVGPDAEALRHIFFAERSAPRRRSARPAGEPLRSAAVVGAGAMGIGIAAELAIHGLSVHVVDVDVDRAAQAADAVRSRVARLGRRRHVSAATVAAYGDAVTASADVADLAEAELIIEAVFEDLEVKTSVLRAAAAAAPGAVLATNTSYLGVGHIADALPDPSALIGLHFFNPPQAMRLVEVVSGPKSAATSVAAGLRLVKDIEKCAVLAGDGEGFIGNRIFAVYRRHAEYLLEDGALPDQVDTTVQEFGLPMGPFAVADLSGLQIAQALRRSWRQRGVLPARYVDIPDKLCDLGRLGRRTSAGYYTYDADGTPTLDSEVIDLIVAESARKGLDRPALSADEILDRTIGAMVVEGARAVADGVAAHIDDIDVVLVNGFGFPRHLGGPVWWARQQPLQRIAALTAAVAKAAHEPDHFGLVREVIGGGE
ncbi:3-hydroxyacyl-CoA dehydrogenase NAD-binding domain-containing protein [Nocardia sp. NPDC005366]|uniref:3-hydroxyacyl-CoA dehydrogenase NAD-binding domain-containing protein n=1 Tax=Nocardia sp. NPDC005366 TaxID=3156878 RepID=UPI0033BC081E